MPLCTKACLAFAGIFLSLVCAVPADTIGILVAFSDDVQMLGRGQEKQVEIEAGREFVRYEMGGHHFIVTISRAGLSETAITTTLLLSRYKPDLIVSLGVAGGLNDLYKQGDVFIADGVNAHDRGSYKEVEGYLPYRVDYEVSKKVPLFESFKSILKEQFTAASIPIHFGKLISGNSFIAHDTKRAQLARRFQADAVDMNAAGLMLACKDFDVPYIIGRVISDHADRNASKQFNAFVKDRASLEKRLRMIQASLVEALSAATTKRRPPFIPTPTEGDALSSPNIREH